MSEEDLPLTLSNVTREEACRKIACQILESFKTKNPKLIDELVAYIWKTGKTPTIKLYWDPIIDDLKFEVIEFL